MADLTFRYGAMGSGKSTVLMQLAYNHDKKGMKTMVLKPLIDTKGNDHLVSRTNLRRKVDFLIDKDDSIVEKIIDKLEDVKCILVDEAQFLTPHQINELSAIAHGADVKVICYGLRTDFKTNGFPGSIRLMEIADKIEELTTIVCECGNDAKFNARIVNNNYVYDGEQVAIDETDNITYESLCPECYYKKVHKFVKVKNRRIRK